MAGETIFARISYTGSNSSNQLTSAIIKWELSQPITGHSSGELGFDTDSTQSDAAIDLDLKTQLAAYITTLTGQAFTAADIHGNLLGGSASPLTMQLASLAIVSPMTETVMQASITVKEVSGYLRGLTVGAFTIEVRVKSDNRLIATLSWAPADVPGPKVVTSLSEFVETADSLVYNVTASGLGASGCTITTWIQ